MWDVLSILWIAHLLFCIFTKSGEEAGALEDYVYAQGKALRRGYTTGSCAAMAAQAATRSLLTGQACAQAGILTPKGVALKVPVEDLRFEADWASCAVRKDGGDDPDVTHGILIYARVSRTGDGSLTVDGGEGVGRVTRRGLDQPVGAAAINRVPRKMIEEAVAAVCEECGYDGGLSVVISIPEGAARAERTFNPHLGIVGGLSVLGTSGIVEPMSTQAILDTIATEMRMYYAEGARDIVLTPGNYGTRYLAEHSELTARPAVKCSNFIGEALDLAAIQGFSAVLLVGHVGKLVKVAGGIMETHSRVADTRMELLALQAALAGGDTVLLHRILACPTTDAALDLLAGAGLREGVMTGLLAQADRYLERRVKGAFAVGVVMFSNEHGDLGASPGGQRILERWRETK